MFLIIKEPHLFVAFLLKFVKFGYMATKKVYEIKKLSVDTRLMTSKGVFILNDSLSQRKLKMLYDMGVTSITVKIVEDDKNTNG